MLEIGFKTKPTLHSSANRFSSADACSGGKLASHAFAASLVRLSPDGGAVRVSSSRFQPMAADDVAAALADVAVSDPRRGIIEIAGPEAAPMDEIVRRFFEAQGDSRKVIGDRSEPYFGTPIDAQSLTPGPGARLGRIWFADWLRPATTKA